MGRKKWRGPLLGLKNRLLNSFSKKTSKGRKEGCTSKTKEKQKARGDHRRKSLGDKERGKKDH